jgi:hypothetical protein
VRPLVLALVLAVASTASAEDVNSELVRWYAKAANYRAVKKDVLDWHGTTRNGCVAFASTALRHIGVEIPLREKIDGMGVSRITWAFSVYLEERLGWDRVTDLAKLRPGDVVFTADDPCCEGVPAHVVVFVKWKDARRRVAWVIDNQGFTHARALRPGRGDATSAFAYALRAPSES